MKKILTLFLIPFLTMENCHHASKQNQDLSGLLQLFLQSEPQFLFTFPGRDVRVESKEKVKETVIKRILSSKRKIHGYIYGLSDLDVLIALRSAKNRGVEIYLQGDREEDYTEAESFGLVINRWRGSGIHHLKILIFDEEIVLFGTGNYTSSGLTRDNNVFWEEKLDPSSFSRLLTILKEEDNIGIFTMPNRKYYFAPEAGYLIQDKILHEVRNAKKNIRFMIYTHYDPLLSYELSAACKRGVTVEGIYNDPVNPEGQVLSSSLPYPCKIYADGNVDSVYQNGSYSGGLLHHKTMIIDQSKVILGSYNFTVSARDENREFFTEFTDTQSTSEFLGEWSRVKSLAKPISDLPEETLTNQKLLRLTSGNFLSLLLLDQTLGKPYINKNSSGLAKELNQSLGLSDSLTPALASGFNQKRDSQDTLPLSSSFLWLGSPLEPLSSFSMIQFWDKVQIQTTPNVSVKSILFWDGKKNPTRFDSLSDQLFPVAMLEQIKSEKWIVFDTGSSFYFSCTQKRNEDSSKWITYLKQKQVLNGFVPAKCVKY